jgi:hypothetical protein
MFWLLREFQGSCARLRSLKLEPKSPLTFNGNRDIAESGCSRGGLLSYRKRRGFGRAGVNRYDETWSSRRARSKLLSFLLERLQLRREPLEPLPIRIVPGSQERFFLCYQGAQVSVPLSTQARAITRIQRSVCIGLRRQAASSLLDNTASTRCGSEYFSINGTPIEAKAEATSPATCLTSDWCTTVQRRWRFSLMLPSSAPKVDVFACSDLDRNLFSAFTSSSTVSKRSETEHVRSKSKSPCGMKLRWLAAHPSGVFL